MTDFRRDRVDKDETEKDRGAAMQKKAGEREIGEVVLSYYYTNSH